jgi:hypothetical protein
VHVVKIETDGSQNGGVKARQRIFFVHLNHVNTFVLQKTPADGG